MKDKAKRHGGDVEGPGDKFYTELCNQPLESKVGALLMKVAEILDAMEESK